MTIYSYEFLLLPCQVDGLGPHSANASLGAEGETSHNMPQWDTDDFLKLYWSIVVLQCFISFCSTAQWTSYMYTYILPFFDFFPI